MRLTETGFDMGLGHRTGWHTRQISKVEFGTWQKVIEEYEEFLDARSQGLKLTMGFELADMIGAIAGLLYTFPEFRQMGWVNRSLHALQGADYLQSAVKRFEKAWRCEPKPGPSMVEAIEASERLITAVLNEGLLRGFSSDELLSQAQLRSAITVNGRKSCSP